VSSELQPPPREGDALGSGGVGRSAGSDDFAIARRIRERRLACGFSQEKLAERIGLTFQQVQKYEKGINRISAGKLLQIADALSVPAAWFFDGLGKIDAPEMLPIDAATARLRGSGPGIALILAAARIDSNETLSAAARLLDSIAETAHTKPA
jgi:transcriptional regulator with XRE-family HTH domain